MRSAILTAALLAAPLPALAHHSIAAIYRPRQGDARSRAG